MPTQTRAEIALPESTGYLEVDGAYLHATLHAAAAPVARILLIGAFASQRQYSYLPWIRWARYLATRQLEVLRFDYRGMGESTGQFEQATYADWLRDVRALAHWLNSRLPAAPLILHGLEMGAILAGKVFDEGCGDMLLLWSPPDKANQALRSTLLSWIAIEQIFKVGAERKSASEYIRKLESGSSLDVEGYTWTQQLWRESFAFDLPSALANEESAGAAYKRPVRIVKLSKAAAPLVKGGFVGYDEFKDFSPIFDTNADWIERTLMTSREGAGDRGGEQMIEAIETRELITLDRSGIPLRGTYHKPISLQTVPESGPSCRRLGILFLNSLSLPRTATGDSAVYWADALAAAGYPSFRIDLPGLGDSQGSIPGDFLDYVNSGGYAQTISLAVKELLTRFRLSGMLLCGHCAGAVSAIFAASAAKECKGLVLMDPYFHLNQAVRHRVRQKLSNWARWSKLGNMLSDVYDQFRAFLLHLRHNALPSNANCKLLERWQEVAAGGIPILYLKAPDLKAPGVAPRVGEFDYLQHILDLAGPRSRVVVQLIEGTDHSFANRLGRTSVLTYTEKWLRSCFPLPQSNGAAVSDSRIPAGSE